MRYLPILFLLLLAACGRDNPATNTTLLKTSNLAPQFYNIDVTKDTILRTANGALIKIVKGSLQAEGSSVVKLEIKEAYTIADMVLAGLTTQAGSEPLSSGGMIYINPAAGQKVTIVRPIEVSIPTPYMQEGMQLYKGVAGTDSSIAWTDPTPLPKTDNALTLAEGKALYAANCSSCHRMDKEATGPALAYIYQRRDWDWLKRFTGNSAKMIASGDRLSNCLFEHWGRTVMTAFPMSEDSLLALYKYIAYESEKYDPATVPDFAKCLDSCEQYEKQKTALSAKRSRLLLDNGQVITAGNKADTITVPVTANTGNSIVPNNLQSQFYRINIDAFGWYNIDIALKNIRDFKESTLTVRVNGRYVNSFNIYLIVPRDRIYVSGGLLKGKDDEYGFYQNDGRIPLPQGVIAYILALGETEGRLLYSITPFTTTTEQVLGVTMTATTVQALTMEIRKLPLSGFNLDVDESKNAREIREIDTALHRLENLIPRGCDCDCRNIEGLWEVTE